MKELDKSAFLHRGTHIPLEVLKFWGKQLQVGEHRSIVAYFHDTQYSMDLVREAHGRTRLFWKSDFVEIIHTQFPEAYEAFNSNTPVEEPPEIRFRKQNEDAYIIDLIDESKNEIVKQTDNQKNNHLTFAEGKSYDYTGTRFERDPKNRKLAIQYHGLTCFGCGFNFGAVYGTHGEGFIEIHHLNPLYLNEAEVIIDPYTDLIPLCSNCHRMVHRSRTRTLTIDELKKLIRK